MWEVALGILKLEIHVLMMGTELPYFMEKLVCLTT